VQPSPRLLPCVHSASSAPASATVVSTKPDPASGRLVSLDALRGLDMACILGIDALTHALARAWDVPPLRFLARQFDHKAWAGFALYDLIFPLFIFVVGVSTVFSLSKIMEQQGRAAAVKRVLWRGGLLFVIGLFYSGGVVKPLARHPACSACCSVSRSLIRAARSCSAC